MPKIVILTKEQEDAVMTLWNSRPPDKPPTVIECVRIAWPDIPGINSGFVEGIAVKKFLASRKLKTAGYLLRRGLIPLTDEQKEYIDNNCDKLRAFEMARILWKDIKINSVSRETKTIRDYLKSINHKVVFENTYSSESADSEYRPPKTIDNICGRINKYVLEGVDFHKLTPRQKHNANALIGYLHTHRFVAQINSYTSLDDRELFESEFIRCTYDKGDLTEEDVDKYIVYATEVVTGKSILRRMDQFNTVLDEMLGEDARVFNQGLVDTITGLHTESNACIKRQQSLLNDLQEKRSDRLSQVRAENSSLTQLIDFWRDAVKRKQIVEYAKLRQAKLKDESGRIKDMDELVMQVWGLNPDELITS